MAELQLRPLLSVLCRHDVRFVVIGAIAAIAHGYPLTTRDLDVTPDRSRENVGRLVAALEELGTELCLPDGTGLAFPVEAVMLAQSESWTLTTSLGDLDILFLPAGTQGYADLRRGALEIDLGDGLRVLMASLADVIRSKEALSRPKDRAQLPALRQTLELLREREGRGR